MRYVYASARAKRETFRRIYWRIHWQVKQMNWGNLHLIDWDRDSFKALVGRKMGERRRDERRLAEQRTTKHQFQAGKSCIADARSYRIARRLPLLAAARFG